jgi:hypothetical protein
MHHAEIAEDGQLPAEWHIDPAATAHGDGKSLIS